MNNYLKDLFIFSKYFTSDLKGNFIDQFKKIIQNNFDNKTFLNTQYLYPGSNSCLYFPKKNIANGGKKSVLLVTHEMSRTGAPVVILDTAKVLIKNGYFVTIISPTNGPLLEEFLQEGIPVIISHELSFLQMKIESTEILKKGLDLDYFVRYFDKIIFNTATLYNFIKRYMNTNKKIIWWLHEGSETYKGIGDRIPKFLTENIEVYCVGQYAANQLQEYGFHYNPKILLYGVSDCAKKSNKTVKTNKIRFLTVGSINGRKGQQYLIEAIKNLPKKYLEMAEFLIIGDSAFGDSLGEKIKNNLIDYAKQVDNVKVSPTVKREELFKIYETIDVLVLPSTDDPMPIVATESFMFRKICLCSKNTGTASYIKDKENGFVFESENVAELTDKILYILKNIRELDNIKENGRKIFENYFDMSIFEKNILSIINENCGNEGTK